MGKLSYYYKSKKSAEEIKASVEKKKEKCDGALPKWIVNNYYAYKKDIGGYSCYMISSGAKFSGTWIFYLYGSSLCFYPSNRQWSFAMDVMERTETGLIVPVYPLTPEHSCRDTFKMLMEAYQMVSCDKRINKVVLMGDEMGAGLALSLSLQIWKEGLKKPDKMILISPSLDTEFFDKEMEKNLISKSLTEKKMFYSQSVKDFLNKYWVKDYAGMTEFTSPIYEDFTDICDTILVISGTEGIFNCYARKFYNKAKQGGMNVMLYEYSGMKHNFILNKKYPQAEHAKKLMTDVITDRRDNIIDKYMYEVKQRSEWTKKFPEIFSDDLAVKYLCNNKITYEKYRNGQNDYGMMISAAKQRSFDDEVKKFLMEYPDGTVVYLGCGLDTMFDRTDNGRVNWYNCDSPGRIAMRRLYISDNTREKTVDKAIFDYTWMDELDFEMKKGIMFVCNNHFAYMKPNQVKELLAKIWGRFPGCFILFDVASYSSMLFTNVSYRRKEINFNRRRFYMDTPEREISNWNSNYKVISDDSILKNIKINPEWSGILKMKFRYTWLRENYKIVHLRLGTEKYETEII